MKILARAVRCHRNKSVAPITINSMDLVLCVTRHRNQQREKQHIRPHRDYNSRMVNILQCYCNSLLFLLHSSCMIGSVPLTQTTTSTSTHTKTTDIHSVHDITSGCSRTIPIAWNNSSLLQVCIDLDLLPVNLLPYSRDFYFTIFKFLWITSENLILQIKREPCQVSEVTTSNNIPLTATVQQQKPDKTIITHSSIIKSEIKSPTEATSSTVSISTATSNMEHNNTNTVQSG